MYLPNENDFMNNVHPKFPEPSKSKVYVICAALWIKDNEIHVNQPRNIDSGLVVAGRRHHNCFLTIMGLSNQSAISFSEDKIIQGFITSDDRFLDRKEAGVLAFESGQTEKLQGLLFSEDLY